MRWLPAVLGAFAMSALPHAAAADFPLPDKLPPNPELPDPLVMMSGERVTTKEQWAEKRRPELKRLFEHYMYGKHPGNPSKVTGTVLFEDPKAFGGKGTLREVEVKCEGPVPATIYLLMAVPNDRQGPAPCFVGINFPGNHALVADERVRIPTAWVSGTRPGAKDNRATAEGRGKTPTTWPFEQVIARGYAAATFYSGDIQPDRPGVSEGLRAVLPKPGGQSRGDETATIMSWAWGVQRAVDYLTHDKDIDGKRIAAVGHSRLGKTVLVAGAFDDRIAVVIPHQSGTGGAAPSRSRNPKAEPVARINTAFPHWFCDNFKRFNDDPSRLPFDQHALAALCAPRPVLFTNATEDQWANPSGQFDVLKAAAPVYKLLGVEGVGADQEPAVGALLASRLGYWVRPGKHSMTPDDWKAFMDYADKWLK